MSLLLKLVACQVPELKWIRGRPSRNHKNKWKLYSRWWKWSGSKRQSLLSAVCTGIWRGMSDRCDKLALARSKLGRKICRVPRNRILEDLIRCLKYQSKFLASCTRHIFKFKRPVGPQINQWLFEGHLLAYMQLQPTHGFKLF